MSFDVGARAIFDNFIRRWRSRKYCLGRSIPMIPAALGSSRLYLALSAHLAHLSSKDRQQSLDKPARQVNRFHRGRITSCAWKSWLLKVICESRSPFVSENQRSRSKAGFLLDKANLHCPRHASTCDENTN